MAEITRTAAVIVADRDRLGERLARLLGRAGIAIWLVLTYSYILFAAVFVILLSLQSDLLAVPSALTLRWFGAALTWPAFRTSLTTSIVVALVVTLLACLLG